MISGTSAALRRIFDYEDDEASALTFPQIAARVNLRRLPLVVMLGLINMAQQIYLGLTGPWDNDTVTDIAMVPVLLVVLVTALMRPAWLNRPGLAKAFVMAAIIFVIAMYFAGTAFLVMNGRITSGFPLLILGLAALFVFPPRDLCLLAGGSTALYILLLLGAPVSAWERLVAIFNAILPGLAAITGGWLIYASRERDYVQRRLIRDQADQIAARRRHLDELMAITAHDLQSPLLGLHNLFELTIERGAANPALPIRVLKDSQPSVRAMLDLVRRLLLAHKAEHDPGMPPVHEDMRFHLTAAIERARPMAESADVTIVPDLGPVPAMAVLEPFAIAQILDNLLSNAVRFSPAGGRVTARCACSDAVVAITIADQGPGVADSIRPLLFEKFRGGGTVTRDGVRGTGFGLFIAERLAARMAATLSYAPNAPTGARFTLSLPEAPLDRSRDR